jgi:hypothetical protein
MYYLVRYIKPKQHIKGAKNIVDKNVHRKPFKYLLDAEWAFLHDCINLPNKPGEGFRLDDARYNKHLEYWSPTNGKIYVLTNKRSLLDPKKFAYKSYTLPAYRSYLIDKKKNLLTQII